MKEAQLIVLLSQNKEERIAKFQKFAKIVPPNCVGDLNKKHEIFERLFLIFVLFIFGLKFFLSVCYLF